MSLAKLFYIVCRIAALGLVLIAIITTMTIRGSSTYVFQLHGNFCKHTRTIGYDLLSTAHFDHSQYATKGQVAFKQVSPPQFANSAFLELMPNASELVVVEFRAGYPFRCLYWRVAWPTFSMSRNANECDWTASPRIHNAYPQKVFSGSFGKIIIPVMIPTDTNWLLVLANILIWCVCIVIAYELVFVLPIIMIQGYRRKRGLCIKCAYPLEKCATMCPECGNPRRVMTS